MNFIELMHIVWVNLMENKTKVILTSLGIIVGAATIVMVLAIGNGSQQAVKDQYKTINAGAINVSYQRANQAAGGAGGGGFAGPPVEFGGSTNRNSSGGGGGGFNFQSMTSSQRTMLEAAMQRERNTMNITLSQTDVDDLQTFVPGLDSAAIWATASSGVTGGNLTSSTNYAIAGITPDYQTLTNLNLGLGSFLTADDETSESKVCVIGYKAAEDIFGDAIDAYGSIIYINNSPFTINGVLNEMGSVQSGVSPDSSIFMPLSSAKKYVFSSQSYSPTITVVASDVTQVENTITNIKNELGTLYPSASFTISDAGAERVAAENSANTLSFMLIAVASIVFVVGGIGIMNVLFVSVRERTKEIGILKAIGTGKGDILMQFLMEAIVISLFGGLVGILLSNLLMPLMSLLGQTVAPSATGVIIALGFAVVTGTVFGFYPALQASSLVPIEALNEE